MESTLAHRIFSLLERARGERPVLVVGGGVTGRAVAALLARAKYQVTVLDERAVAKTTRDELAGLDIVYREEFVPNAESLAWLQAQNFALAVLSPGIGFESPLGAVVGEAGIPRISEIDLGIAFIGMPTVAVTGTNGKTTTVTLVHEMLAQSGFASELVGNVGRPFVSLVTPERLGGGEHLSSADDVSRAKIVAEVSSYQLETAYDFSPHIGVFLNIEDDHLERHGTFDDYLLAKSRLFSGQDKERDFALVWADDPYYRKISTFVRSRLIPFGVVNSERRKLEWGCFINELGDAIECTLGGVRTTYSLKNWKPLGLHNKINLAAAIASAQLAGATEEGITDVIENFRPLPHRIEVVSEEGGVLWVNDSKGTNVSAVKVALETVLNSGGNEKIILLLGGKAKEGSWKPLREALTARVKQIILFGASADEIQEKLEITDGEFKSGLFVKIPAQKVGGMDDAVQAAAQHAQSGDIVLLSPGCASFDAFRDYAHRGERFRELVQSLSTARLSPKEIFLEEQTEVR